LAGGVAEIWVSPSRRHPGGVVARPQRHEQWTVIVKLVGLRSMESICDFTKEEKP
jgi:hypothetical protein